MITVVIILDEADFLHVTYPQCLLEAGARVDADTMDVAERLGRHHISKLLSTYLPKK